MTVARGLIEELFLMEGERRAGAVGLQGHGDQRLALRRRMPDPAKHQPLVRHDFAVDAADLIILPAFIFEAEAVAPADAEINICLDRAILHLRRPAPSGYFCRIGPRGVDLFRPRVEVPLEGETWARGETGVDGGVWFDGHGSSSTKAARRSRLSDQKR